MCPILWRRRGRPRTHWSDSVSWLVWSLFRISRAELEEVDGKRKVWGSLFRPLSPQHGFQREDWILWGSGAMWIVQQSKQSLISIKMGMQWWMDGFFSTIKPLSLLKCCVSLYFVLQPNQKGHKSYRMENYIHLEERKKVELAFKCIWYFLNTLGHLDYILLS